MRRRQIFFEQKLDAIGKRLQQAEGTDAGRAPAILDVAHHFPLQPNGISHRREQHKQCQRGLDERNNDEGFDTQQYFAPSSCKSGSKGRWLKLHRLFSQLQLLPLTGCDFPSRNSRHANSSPACQN